MPEYRRWRTGGATYFFTVVTHKRRRLFESDTARRLLSGAFTEIRNDLPFETYAIVLLPDHLHCIWTMPPDDERFSLRWARIKLAFTRAWRASGGPEAPTSATRTRRNERGVWQRRFWEHQIRDEAELFAYRDYIHLNPVKHGLVQRPENWPHSSLHRFLRNNWLAGDWASQSQLEVWAGE